jgi:hypothetical protein
LLDAKVAPILRPVRVRSTLMTLTVCLLVLAGAYPVGAGAAGAGAVCGPAGAHTLAADSRARVYSNQGKVYGCARSGSKSYPLGKVDKSVNEGRVGPLALSGVDVAYGLTSYGVDTINASIMVRRLTDGQVVRQHRAINEAVGAEYFETVDAVVVKRDGSVAWIAHATWVGSQGKSVTEVDKSDRTNTSLLDSSPSIVTNSLRLHRSELSWEDGSSSRSATLS